MKGRLGVRYACAVAVVLLSVSTAIGARNDQRDARETPARSNGWRRAALETMHVAATSHLLTDERELDRYTGAGFNTQVVFDTDGVQFKSADEVRSATEFARTHHFPLLLGMAVEAYAAIPQQSDDAIRARLQLWETYGDDVIVGVLPWYDDVFWQTVDVGRQRHIYQLIKDATPQWYVFGMIGEYGIVATDDKVARYYDAAAFDHLIVLMYPYNVGAPLTGFPLDNVASHDPDRDIAQYVVDYVARMDQRFFAHLREGQLILLVSQAFYYDGEAAGHIPRANDIAIMMQRGSEQIRGVHGQENNFSVGSYWWGEAGSELVGLSQRQDWLAAARDANDSVERLARAQRP